MNQFEPNLKKKLDGSPEQTIIKRWQLYIALSCFYIIQWMIS
jgi:hypothetical protein